MSDGYNKHALDGMAAATRKFIKLHQGEVKSKVRESFLALIERCVPEGAGWQHTNFDTQEAFDWFFDLCWDMELRCN